LQRLPALVMAPNLKRDIDELVAAILPAGNIAVIDDAHTSTAYGDQVRRALAGRYSLTHIMLARGAQADDAALAEIETKSKRADLLVAVGSGTINDLVKLASHKAGKPYIVFPTAASMNGYVSQNASITIAGHKQSVQAQLPLAVFMDMQVITAAPIRLTQAGLGDCLARPTAQGDWLISHHLLGTAYDEAPYQLIAPYEAPVLEQANELLHGDAQAMEALMMLLLLSGFGMTIAGSSIPASGAEHMVAHAYGMGNIPSARVNLHGEEIALTTLHMAKRQQQLMEGDIHLATAEWPRAMIDSLFAAEEIASFAPLYEKKKSAAAHAFPGGQVPRGAWEKAREAISAIHIAPEKLEKTIKAAALPDSTLKLGWDANHYAEITRATRFTRDRFTCLDVESKL